MTTFHMQDGLGVPTKLIELFEGPDSSWQLENEDFCNRIRGERGFGASIRDGIQVFEQIEKVYSNDYS